LPSAPTVRRAVSTTGVTASTPPANASHAPVIHLKLVDCEPLANLGASLAGSVDQDLVEDCPARTEQRFNAFERGIPAFEYD
jgi:hypothetical protein